MYGIDMIKAIENKGIKLAYAKDETIKNGTEYVYRYGYEWSKETEQTIYKLGVGEWEEPVIIRYAGGWGFVDCGTPYIEVWVFTHNKHNIND